MTNPVTGLVIALEAGEGGQVDSLALLAGRCLRIEGREAKEDFLPQSRSGETSGRAARLAAGSSVCLVERILARDLHNGALVVEPGLAQLSAAVAARTGLTGGLERLLILHHHRGVLTISTRPEADGGGGGEMESDDELQLAVDDGGEAVLVYQQVVLPLALHLRPELVVAALSPDCPPHLVRMLAGLAGGRLVLVLQSGHHLATRLLLSSLLADPAPVTSLTLTPGGDTVWSTVTVWDTSVNIKQHWRHQGEEKEGQEKVVEEVETFHFCELEERRTKLWLLYDPEMEKHFTTATYTSHNGIVLRPYPECPERTQAIWRALEEANIPRQEKVGLVEPGRKVEKAECCLVHTDQFWTDWLRTETFCHEERERLSASLDCIYLNSSSVHCARLAAGGVLQCVDQLITDQPSPAFAVVRPPGHHAEADCSAGFCIFNNVAIGAAYSVKHHGLNRVLILDWDVHHGNGTQHMFYADNKVLYMSLHRYDYAKFYPCSEDANYDKVGEGEGEGFNVNIPWNGQQFGDSEYMLAFHSVVLPIAYEFNPELILISAGFDAARGDPLSGYCVSPAMYGYMSHQLTGLASSRVLVVLEGGYNIDSIAQSSLSCAEALLGHSHNLRTPSVTTPRDSAVQTVNNVVRQLAPYWRSLPRLG